MERRNTFSINFLCRASKADRKGKSPVEIVITRNCERVVIQTELKMNESDFKADMKSKRSSVLSEFIEGKTARIYGIIAELNSLGIEGTPRNIKDRYKGKALKKTYTVEDIIKEYAEYVKGNGSSRQNYMKHLTVERDMREYLANHPISVEEICSGWVKGFQNHLLSFQDSTTVAGKMQKFRSAWNFAMDSGKVSKNPFIGVKLIKKTKEAVYLTKEEVIKIYTKDFGLERLNKIRDIFVFVCHTGLAFSDLCHLKKDDILFDERSGYHYLNKERQKTGVKFFVPLTAIPMGILEKYEYSLPVLSCQKYNGYLKEIADIVGITKKVTSHTARHTFATILLNEGFDLATVSKCLGHSNIGMTTHYAKLLNHTVLEEFKRIGK